MDRINEIQARLAEISAAIDNATGEALTTLETESRNLLDELKGLQDTAKARQELRQQIAQGAGAKMPGSPAPKQNAEERAAAEFAKTNRMTIDAEQSRAHLISSGTLAQPTKLDGINDIVDGNRVSSLIDLITVVNCVGMGNHRIAYQTAEASAAADQTEGQAATSANLGAWSFLTIQPESVAVLDAISKQVKKQTTLQYSAKVKFQALLALRKAATAKVVAKLKASTLNKTLNAKVVSSKGVIDETTLRRLAMEYGGDEAIIGGAILLLNKTDLLAFGDVRGTNEKRAIYEITPDSSNPNMGTIRDGGLTVRYCLVNGLTACHGTSQASTATPTMFYGAPRYLELDLFSDYEVRVSEDFQFDKLMDTIRGDVELGADVVAKHGFIAYTIPATT